MPTAARSCPSCLTPLPEEALFCLHCGAATPTDPGVPPRTAVTGPVEVSRVRKALAERYRVEQVLGEGGMATVYLAEDLKHRRKVALKVMRPELSATLGAERFLREVEIAARLSHPHILPMHDSGEADGLLYYVMPHVEGESLRDRMKREGQFPVEDALRLAREAAEALAYAHGRGVVHRDVKPANILVSAGHALVADFGIARAVGGDDAITATGLAIGTPQYMSPEQASGDREVDGRTDIYALGAVLYEMLAGEPPFTGPTPQAILTRSMIEAPRSLTATRALSPAVETMVMKALAKSPADRYPTATHLAQALEESLDQVRRGTTRATAEAGPSPRLVWGLFGSLTIVAMLVVFALVRRWGLPAWTLALAGALLGIGAGVLRATGRAEARRRSGRTTTGISRWLTFRNAALGGGLALALWATVATVLVLRGPGAGSGAGAGGAGQVRLAVLPFVNRGDPDDAYFADGIADEMRGKLAGLGGFQVTAQTSSEQYRQTSKTPQQIGQELGVQYLLTATVRWAKGPGGSRVQVLPELIDARTGGVKWQQAFDADLTDVFQVQTQIASRVAGALGVALGSQDQQRLTERPTENLAAYDLYLKSRAVVRLDPGAIREAIGYLEQAVALDSTFAQGWAQLAARLSRLYTLTTPEAEVAARARLAADRALALDPEGPAGHAARAEYYRRVALDQPKAEAEIRLALRATPNDPELLTSAAMVEKSLGRWDEALVHLQQARRLDPRSVTVINALQNTLLWLRRYPDALGASEAALGLAPGDLSISQDKAMVYLAQGDLAGARAVIREVSPAVAQPALVAFFAQYWDMYWVLEEPQQQLLLRLTPAHFDDSRGNWAIALAQVWWLRGDRAKAAAYADTARAAIARVLAEVPDDPQQNVIYGLAVAYLGRKAEAIAAGQRGAALLPLSRDAVNGLYFQHQLARVYHLVGEPERALDQLEPLLRIPYFLSSGWLRIDPTFAELKGHPRYERMLRGG